MASGERRVVPGLLSFSLHACNLHCTRNLGWREVIEAPVFLTPVKLVKSPHLINGTCAGEGIPSLSFVPEFLQNGAGEGWGSSDG